MAPILLFLIQALTVLTSVCLLALGLTLSCLRRQTRRALAADRGRSIGFFHPYPLAGGGGERVLWCALQATAAAFPDAALVVYGSFRGVGRDELDTLIGTQFGLDMRGVRFEAVDVGADAAALVDAARYPRLTLLLQSMGALRLGFMAFARRPCGVVVETGNFVFALVAPRILGARTLAYVHYPTISADMLALVRTRTPSFNNAGAIARSRTLSAAKTAYYHGFAALYAAAARAVDVALANSSWTRAHLRAVWRRPDVALVFPPCPVLSPSARAAEEDVGMRDAGLVLSLGQFRPEKNHALQIAAFAELEKHHPGHPLRLVMVGGARDERDRMRAEEIRREAEKLGLPVDVRVNVSREELAALLRRAVIGVHTMRDEHFGISVVELQAAGLLVVAHRSGGVAQDIVDDGRTGFLAESEAGDYAERIWEAHCAVGRKKGERMRKESAASAARFCDRGFQEHFMKMLRTVCEQ